MLLKGVVVALLIAALFQPFSCYLETSHLLLHIAKGAVIISSHVTKCHISRCSGMLIGGMLINRRMSIALHPCP